MHNEDPLGLRKVHRALITVDNKVGVQAFARGLSEWGVEIISTGNTASFISAAGVPVVEVSKFTGFPELFGGRLKTIHPKIAGGILYQRGNQKHVAEADEYKIVPVDLVVVNLYDFQGTVSKPGVSFEDAIEKIDIGGPSLIRAAAKNFEDVAVVTGPEDYGLILDDLSRHNGCTSRDTRLDLAVKVFDKTISFDTQVRTYLQTHRS